MDPMHEAMKRRRAKSIDFMGVLDHGDQKSQEPKGDLAPDPKEASSDERKAMHAKMNGDLQGALHDHEMGNPEHKPIERGGLEMDPTGHEEAVHDPAFEAMMQKGHEHDTISRPRTLGARVRAALHSKKAK